MLNQVTENHKSVNIKQGRDLTFEACFKVKLCVLMKMAFFLGDILSNTIT